MNKSQLHKASLCILCCLISLLFATTAKANVDPYAVSYTTYDTTYDKIIKMYIRVLEAHRRGQSDGRHDLFNDNIYWDFVDMYLGDPDVKSKLVDYMKAHIGYAIMDVNGDGIDELLIGRGKSEIYEAFTIDNGKVRELIRAGARYGCHLLSDGTFWRFGSSGASFYGYYAFRMNGTKGVKFTKGYHYNGEAGWNNGYDEPDFWFKANNDKGLFEVTNKMHVPTEKVDQWIKQCEFNLSNINYIPFTAYELGIDSAAIGILTLNGKTTGGQVINIRKTANKKGKLITTKKVGTYVGVLGQDGDFYQITFGKTTGYVHKDYLTLLTEYTETNTEDQIK